MNLQYRDTGPISVTATQAHARNVLQRHPTAMRRKVRCVAEEDTPEAQAIFDLVAGDKFQWTPKEWAEILERVDNCELTVEEWINA